MVCTRLIEATQKKNNKVSHRTLENVLLSKDPITGEVINSMINPLSLSFFLYHCMDLKYL